MQMEMLEMELIKNLQGTQAMQKQSYEQLEKALISQNNREELEEILKMTQSQMSPLANMRMTSKSRFLNSTGNISIKKPKGGNNKI